MLYILYIYALCSCSKLWCSHQQQSCWKLSNSSVLAVLFGCVVVVEKKHNEGRPPCTTSNPHQQPNDNKKINKNAKKDDKRGYDVGFEPKLSACYDDGQKNTPRLNFQPKESGPESDWHCHAQSPVYGQPNSSRHSQADQRRCLPKWKF